MNEHDDDRLKELLDQTAPDSPDVAPASRVTAVADRARAVRRRNGVVVAAAVLAVVGVGVAVPLALSGDDDSAQQDVASDPGPEAAAPPACPAEPIDVTDGLAAKDLPDGAVSARLCPGTYDQAQGTVEFTLPTAPVTDDVDDLLGAIGDLPGGALPPDCAAIMPMPMPWALVVSYPDGSERTLGTTVTACGQVEVAGKQVNVEDVLAAVEQASGSGGEPPEVDPGTGDGAVAACPGPGAESGSLVPAPDTFEGDLADLAPTSAAVCYGLDPDGGQEYADTRGFLEGAALETVLDDVLAATTEQATLAGRCPDPGPVRLVVLAGDQGQVTLADTACSGEFAYANGFWVPGGASEDTIAEALGGRLGG